LSYRRNRDVFQRAWRRKHRNELIAPGLLAELVDDDRRWNHVLLHGDDELVSGWTVSWISEAQARALLALLRQMIGEDNVGYDLLGVLEKRLKR
jgi:hypothetical protein